MLVAQQGIPAPRGQLFTAKWVNFVRICGALRGAVLPGKWLPQEVPPFGLLLPRFGVCSTQEQPPGGSVSLLVAATWLLAPKTIDPDNAAFHCVGTAGWREEILDSLWRVASGKDSWRRNE